MPASELIDAVDRLPALRREWDDLAVAVGRPGSAPDLLLAWLRHMAPAGSAPRVVSVREAGRLVGLAPFLVHPGPRGRPLARLLATPSMPQRSCVLALPGHEDAVCAAVARELAASRPRPAVLSLERIDRGASWPGRMAGAWPGPGRARLLWDQRVPGPGITIGPDGFDAWLSGRSTGFRRKHRLTRRRLAERGAAIVRASDAAGVRRGLEAFGRLHGARWGERSRLWRPDSLAMLQEAGEALLREHRFRLYAVEADDEIVATMILFAAGGQVVAWNGGWNPAWARERPSAALLDHAIEECFALGDRHLDLGEADQPYKTRLADRDDPVAWATVLPRGASYPLMRAVTAPERLRGRARTAARRLPPGVQRALRDARGRLTDRAGEREPGVGR